MSGTDFTLDLPRTGRLGFGEAVFCARKSPGQIAAILEAARAGGLSLLLTRLDDAVFAALPPEIAAALDYDRDSHTAWTGALPPIESTARIAVITAGTSDLPVAREAVRTLRFSGRASTLIADVGVAGLWRLLRHIDELRRHKVVIVAAGMDAALPSVVAGLVGSVVIALPTSVGYGVASGGRAGLDAALASCAPGLAVVNIDNGYGAACLALRVLGPVPAADAQSGDRPAGA